MLLPVWGGTLHCVALEIFKMLCEHSLSIFFITSEKNKPHMSKDWRGPLFFVISCLHAIK